MISGQILVRSRVYVCDVLADPGDRDYSDIYDGDSSYSGHLDGMDELDFIFAE